MRQDDDLDIGGDRATAERGMLIPVIIVAVLLALVLAALVFVNKKDKKQDTPASFEDAVILDTEEEKSTAWKGGGTENLGGAGDAEDPQSGNGGHMSSASGADVDVAQLLLAGDVAETERMTFGVDVAKYQGTIDWREVAASGVEFAMVRVGYRTQKTGEICPDTNAKYNMQEAQVNGIKVGAYFFSTAVTEEEAKEEADWVADYISQYQITYPVAYNCEGFEDSQSRQYNLTQKERSDLAFAFLNRVYERGYTPMFYASRNELEADAKWDTSRISKSYKIWMAWYPTYIDPKELGPDNEYARDCAMWQYTNMGSVPGISEPVDVNVAYFGYEGTADAKSDAAPEQVTADAEALMNFSEINETVTAKEKTNLRDIPSQGADSKVLAALSNGETVTLTGISSSGWSRLEYNGQICYAVSSYLTTDLGYQAAGTLGQEGTGSGDGLKTKFTDTNDTVTAKIEVNLRSLPSVTNPDAAVVAVLRNGETVIRTGINTDHGWSRVEYNGQSLYCVTSYLTVVQ